MADEENPSKPETTPESGSGKETPANPAPAAPEAEASAKADDKPASPAADKGDKAKDKAEPAKDKPAAPEVSNPTVSQLLDDGSGQKKIIRAKGSKNIAVGVAHILATFNNTLVSISDAQGNVLGWSSSGKVGFKGSRKSTAYAAQQVAQDAARQAMAHGVREVEVHVKGPGAGRESAVRALQGIGLEISLIRDVTPVPHNGCRPRKKRRV